jgi:hypothetical protein
MATNPIYLRANPHVADRLAMLKANDKSYIAHEYLNRDWTPMHFSEMEEWLEPAKLQYALSAFLIDNNDALNLSADQQALINAIPDRSFRETVRDFCVNQQFRRDYWVKGLRRLTPFEQVDVISKQRFILQRARQGIELKVKGALGEASLLGDIYNPILDHLADLKIHSMAEIEAAMAPKGVNAGQVRAAMNILVGSNAVHLANDDDVIAKARKSTSKLNEAILRRARSAGDINYLASPVLGSAVGVNRLGQLAISAAREGRKTPAEWAQAAWGVLNVQGQKLIKEGKTIESPEDNLAELTSQIETFAKDNLPLLKAMGVV